MRQHRPITFVMFLMSIRRIENRTPYFSASTLIVSLSTITAAIAHWHQYIPNGSLCFCFYTINHMKEEAWWRDHIWTLSELLASCDGHPSITNGFPLQRRRQCGPLIFPMILTWISWWCETPRRSCDVAVMIIQLCLINITCEVVTYNSIIVTYLWNYHIAKLFIHLNKAGSKWDLSLLRWGPHVWDCPLENWVLLVGRIWLDEDQADNLVTGFL